GDFQGRHSSLAARRFAQDVLDHLFHSCRTGYKDREPSARGSSSSSCKRFHPEASAGRSLGSRKYWRKDGHRGQRLSGIGGQSSPHANTLTRESSERMHWML
ncbi:uncharacterized protein J3R85_003370, partial [Psidium guajava]